MDCEAGMGMFSGWSEQLLENQFGRDQSGRSVFLPFGPHRAGYHLDSLADDQKIKSLVKLYVLANSLLQGVGLLSGYFLGQAVIFPDRPTSLAGKLEVFLVVYSISVLIFFVVPRWLLGRLYREVIPG